MIEYNSEYGVLNIGGRKIEHHYCVVEALSIIVNYLNNSDGKIDLNTPECKEKIMKDCLLQNWEVKESLNLLRLAKEEGVGEDSPTELKELIVKLKGVTI